MASMTAAEQWDDTADAQEPMAQPATETNGHHENGASNPWIQVVTEDWNALASAPAEVRNDADVICAAMRESDGLALQFASDGLRGDREFLLGAAQEIGPAVLEYAADEVKADRDFILEVADFCPPGQLMWYVSEDVRRSLLSDKEFILEAIQQEGAEILGQADDSLRSDRDFILAAAQHCLCRSEAVNYATEGLKKEFLSDPAFMLEEIEQTGLEVLEEATQELRSNRDFILSVARKHGGLKSVLQYVTPELKDELLAAGRAARTKSGIPCDQAALRAMMPKVSKKPSPPSRPPPDGMLVKGMPQGSAAKSAAFRPPASPPPIDVMSKARPSLQSGGLPGPPRGVPGPPPPRPSSYAGIPRPSTMLGGMAHCGAAGGIGFPMLPAALPPAPSPPLLRPPPLTGSPVLFQAPAAPLGIPMISTVPSLVPQDVFLPPPLALPKVHMYVPPAQLVETPTPVMQTPTPVMLTSKKIGIKVKRGPDWCWEEQDGGDGNIGITENHSNEQWIQVRWDASGEVGVYRIGLDGAYDLYEVGGAVGAPGPAAAAEALPPWRRRGSGEMDSTSPTSAASAAAGEPRRSIKRAAGEAVADAGAAAPWRTLRRRKNAAVAKPAAATTTAAEELAPPAAAVAAAEPAVSELAPVTVEFIEVEPVEAPVTAQETEAMAVEQYEEIDLQEMADIQAAQETLLGLPEVAQEAAQVEVVDVEDEDVEIPDFVGRRHVVESSAESGLRAIQEVGAKALETIPVELREDREFMLAASRLCPLLDMLSYASEKLRVELYADREFMLRAAEEAGAAMLAHAAKELTSDLGFMMEAAAVTSPAEAMRYAARELRMELESDDEI